MPLYFYRCRRCGNKFEMIRRISDADSEVACPECRQKEAEKIIAPVYGHNSLGGAGFAGAAGGGFRIG